MGFKQTSGDPCLYVHLDSEGEMFLVGVYVDDIILRGKSNIKMSVVKKELSHKFEMKDLGPLHYFLVVKVIHKRESGAIWVGQPVYAEKILQRYGMQDSKPVSTPCQSICQTCCLREAG